MFARDIMTNDVIIILPTATVHEATRMLAEYSISGMPVVDRATRLVGIVTSSDIMSRIGNKVTDIMTHHVITVTPNTPVEQIAQILTGNRIKRVPVLEGTRLSGIVTRADIVRMMAGRWTCGICGAIHIGTLPEVCDACGAPSHLFHREFIRKPEITTR